MKVTIASTGASVSVVGGGSSVRVSGLGAQGVPGPASPKSFALEWPVNGESVTMFYTPYAITLADLHTVLVGTGSVALEVWYGARRDVPGTRIAAHTASSSTTGDDVTLTVAAVPAASYVWMNVLSVTGEVRELHMTAWF